MKRSGRYVIIASLLIAFCGVTNAQDDSQSTTQCPPADTSVKSKIKKGLSSILHNPPVGQVDTGNDAPSGNSGCPAPSASGTQPASSPTQQNPSSQTTSQSTTQVTANGPTGPVNFTVPPPTKAFPVVQVRPDPPVPSQFQITGLAAQHLQGCGQSSKQALQCGLILVALLNDRKASDLPVLAKNFAPGAVQERWDDQVGSGGKFRRLWNAKPSLESYAGGGGPAAVLRIEMEREFRDIIFTFDSEGQLADFNFEVVHLYSSDVVLTPQQSKVAQDAVNLVAAFIRHDSAVIRRFEPLNPDAPTTAHAVAEDFARAISKHGVPLRYFVVDVTDDSEDSQDSTCTIVVVQEHAWFQLAISFAKERLADGGFLPVSGRFPPSSMTAEGDDTDFERN